MCVKGQASENCNIVKIKINKISLGTMKYEYLLRNHSFLEE